MEELCATRRDLAAVESGDEALAQRIREDLLRPPILAESALVLDDGKLRRTPAEIRAMFRGLCSEHDTWLAPYPMRHLKRWHDQLASDASVEGAIWEALCRRWLQYFADTVEPAEDDAGGGPDFHCVTDGTSFYAEATCLSIDAMSKGTSLSDGNLVGGSYALATPRVWKAVEGKQRQCQARDDAPTIVVVGTLHQSAAWLAMGERVATELLTGRPSIAWRIHLDDDVQVGSSGPFSKTELHGAAFVAADGMPEQPLGTRNRHVAAVLVGTMRMFYPRRACAPAPFVGALDPHPAVDFDPLRALPGVRFLRLRDGWQHGRIEVEDVLVDSPPSRLAEGTTP